MPLGGYSPVLDSRFYSVQDDREKNRYHHIVQPMTFSCGDSVRFCIVFQDRLEDIVLEYFQCNMIGNAEFLLSVKS